VDDERHYPVDDLSVEERRIWIRMLAHAALKAAVAKLSAEDAARDNTYDNGDEHQKDCG